MSVPVLTSLRLTAFKSFKNVELPIDPITVLTGRNSSGKSNALDGLEVLSRLATGEDLGDALDGRRREGGTVRGGSRGCAPHGENQFALGCTVRVDGDSYNLDIVVETEPELQITRETLSGPAGAVELRLVEPSGARKVRRLLTPRFALAGGPYPTRDEALFRAAKAVSGALLGIFHLDPVPHLMRDYVPAGDTDLRRTGENISAALAKLGHDDPAAFARLINAVRAVADERISGITVSASPLGDVMLALTEEQDGRSETTPARELSDGLLRFVAVATALLTSRGGLDIDTGPAPAVDPSVLLVIEELENGLHPSQAGNVLELIKDAVSAAATRVMVTTHSPALLNYMTGELTRSVLVCYRDGADGRSRISRLPDLPGYAQAMAAGRLGDVVSDGRLIRPETAERDFSEFNRLLGIE